MVHRKILVCALALTLFGLQFITAEMSAQTFRGGINGGVTDSTGAVLPQALVTATNEATALTYKTTSSGAGVFSFQDLPPGSYLIEITASGFQKTQFKSVVVLAGKIHTLDGKLNVATQPSTVQVSAAAVALDTTTVSDDTLLSTQTVQDIPINGRDFTQLVDQSAAFSGYMAVGSVNGTRSTGINWQIEGADNNDPWGNMVSVNQVGVGGIAGVLLPLDSVDEFSLQNLGAAETGRNPGGTLNLAIKSGTNQFHGSAYYYNRNEFFAAQSPFVPPSLHKNALRNQHYGFSLGGPIRKDKTFLFLNLEEQKYLIGNQSRSTEPSEAYQAESQALLKQYNVPVNPVSANLLNGLWPASALTGPATAANYFNPNSTNGYSHNGLLKLDHSFNEDNRVSFRVFLGQGTQTAPNSTHLSPYWEVVPSHMQNYDAIYNRVISSRFTNQLVAGVNYFLQTFVDADTTFNPIALGLNTGVTAPILAGAPNIVIAGFDQVGVNPFSGRTDVTGHLTDTLSYVTGKHQLRFGGEFRRTQVDVYYNFGARGVFDFTGGQGPWAGLANNPTQDTNVLSLADFMAGYVYQSTNTIGNSERLVHVNSFNLFGQDAYQATRKLNLNFGLRYEYEGPLHDNKQDLSVFVPSRGLVVAGQGVPSIYPQDFLNFSPRVGFAYQPRDNRNFVVRGSYGIFFDTPPIIPFLDNVFLLNNGPLGTPDNPAGNNPVFSVQVNDYTIVKDQPIFPTGPVPILGSNVLNLFSVSQTLHTPYYEMYSLNVQQSLGHHWIVQVGYVGSEGRRLLVLGDINQAALGSGFNSTTVIGPNGGTFSYQQSTRPFFSKYPNFGVINEVQSEGTSNYSSLQTTLRSSQWHGLTAQFSYAWGHSLDDMTQACCTLPQDNTNLRGDYGNSDYDVRHHFTANAVYNIPGSSHGPQWLSHGWQLNTVMSFRTGFPFTVHATTDTSGTGENTDRGDQIGNAYAGVSHSLVSHSYVQWVNSASFQDPPQGSFGTMRRNQLTGPGFASVDLSVFKNIPVTERLKAQFRVEMFNIFNRLNLAPPSGYLFGGFGQSTDTIGDYNGAPGIGPGEPFNMQLALKLIF
jgi:hypothetical protein